MTRIHLVRHGETAPNKEGIALGQADVPLTDRGQWQAKQVAEWFRGEKIAAVYSSPLQRALSTAGTIASACGLEPIVHDGLIEMNIGDLEGMPFRELLQRHPGFMAEWAGELGPDVVMPGGERLRDVADRSWAAIESIAGVHAEANVAVVSHNFVILTALARTLGIDLSQFRRLRHAVAAVSVLEFQGDRVSVVSINDTCHLRSGG